MTVENYIRDLLYRYECVIIPEFGALISQRKPAEIHQTTNAFYPPKKSISFNRQLKKNDGLLVNHVAECEKITYEEALRKTQLFVIDMNSVLFGEKEIVLEAIGCFSMEEGDKLLFDPFYKENYLLDSFGLGSFTSEKISREVYKEETEVLEEKTGLVFTPEAKSEAKEKPPYLKYAAVAILAIGLSGLVGMNWYKDQVQTHNLTVQQQAESAMEGKIQQATFMIGDPLPKVTFGIEVQPGKYHVVAGAFREKTNAHKKVNLLIEKGFHAREIGQNDFGLYQVIYGSYQTRRDAVNALRKIQQIDNENAWLLVREL